MSHVEAAVNAIVTRTAERVAKHHEAVYRETDRAFAWLMGVQWLFGIALAFFVSPYAWEGEVRTLHLHVYVAVLLGGLLSGFPIALAILRPGRVVTRHVIAAAQMSWSALLIHLSGGRIETHFHVFGSLGFLAFYRDWRVLLTATLTVAADHLARGLLWPESVYGIHNPEWWRFLEHAFWVVFCNIGLFFACQRGVNEMQLISEREAAIEALSESEWLRSSVLDRDEQSLAEAK